jgi:hypothetical protein
MGNVIDQEWFTTELFDILDETFETHHGYYLDKGTSLFETLETITAQEASRPVGGKCASLAAQVVHITLYLEMLERIMGSGESEAVDWGEHWHTAQEVTPDEWAGLKQQLRQAYHRLLAVLRSRETWDDEAIGGSLAVVAHTAHHLGEIRQALCTLK